MSEILKSKDIILKEWEINESSSGKKRENPQKFLITNEYLWKWYVPCRQSNVPVSGPMLQEEALIISERLGGNSVGFTASNGWLSKWKKRYNISEMKVAGEEGDVSQETLSSWDEHSRELMRGYESRNVWNIDETGQFWRALPDKSLSERRKRCRGGKNSKERATRAFFVRASGEKEAPIVVGKSRNPRCFKSLKDSSRPYKCDYFFSSKAWMTSEIFEEILLRLDQRMKREDRHILLFLDNTPCHPNALIDHFSNIKMAFLPKNTTSRTQPLDAGIIKLWKVKTKRKLLRFVCSKIDGQKTASDIIKSVNLLTAIQWGKRAWDEINQDTIAKCFNKVGLVLDANVIQGNDDDDPFEGEDMLSLEELCKKLGEESLAAKEFVNAD